MDSLPRFDRAPEVTFRFDDHDPEVIAEKWQRLTEFAASLGNLTLISSETVVISEQEIIGPDAVTQNTMREHAAASGVHEQTMFKAWGRLTWPLHARNILQKHKSQTLEHAPTPQTIAQYGKEAALPLRYRQVLIPGWKKPIIVVELASMIEMMRQIQLGRATPPHHAGPTIVGYWEKYLDDVVGPSWRPEMPE